MQASPMATANSSASRQSPTSGPVRKASGQTLTSGPVCEEGERQNPEGAQALEKRRADTHHNLPGVVGHFSPFSQRSGTPPSATKPSPKSGRRSATGHQAASSSRAYQQDSNLPALRGPGSVATSPAVASTEKARGGSGANLLSDREFLEEEVDARSKHSPRHPRPLLFSLEIPTRSKTEPERLERLCARRPYPLRKKEDHDSRKPSKEPKDHNDSPSTPRRSLLVHQHLAQIRASTPDDQPCPMTSRRSMSTKQSTRTSFGPGAIPSRSTIDELCRLKSH